MGSSNQESGEKVERLLFLRLAFAVSGEHLKERQILFDNFSDECLIRILRALHALSTLGFLGYSVPMFFINGYAFFEVIYP